MQGVSVDSTYILYELRLVRRRLLELIDEGGFHTTDELEPCLRLINNALEAVEDGAALPVATQELPSRPDS